MNDQDGVNPDINKILEEGTLIDEALTSAVREAVERKRRLGQHVIIWRDGKVVRLPPEEIPPYEIAGGPID